MSGPLGALPSLSATARRALVLTGALSLVNAGLLVAQAFLLADVLAEIVAGHAGGHGGQLVILLSVVAGRSLAGWAIKVVSARAAAGAKEELRARTVDHALRLGPEWIAEHGSGRLTALTTRGLDALDAYFTSYLPALVTAAVVPLGAGVAVLFADWPSALILVLTVPLLPMFAILIGKYTADRVAAVADSVQRMSANLLELVRALPVLAAFRRAAAQAETVRRLSDRHRRASVKTLRVAFASAFALELIATISVALIAVLIGIRLVSGELPLAIGLGVLILAPECYQPLRAVGAAFHASEDGVEAVRRVTDVLAEPVVRDGSTVPVRGEVLVSGLRVARRGGFAPDGESFSVRPGETVWLRSPSGAGKSTTLGVLLGFARLASGLVTIGGVPLDEVDMSMWRKSVAWVPQSPAFAGGTVRAELELAGEVRDELDTLGLADLADRPISELSPGQRQRVAVARALIRVREGAWLLLMDEPTAHLDGVNAERVMAAVRATGAAVVIAAHDRPDGVVFDLDPPRLPTTKLVTSTEVKPLRLRSLVSRRLLVGVLLGALAALSGIALTATSGWLIAKASQQPAMLTLSVAIVGVRAFGLGRAVLRYAERVITHDAAFRIAGGLRVRTWEALVRRGPARAFRADEGQRRLVDDVDTVRDLLPRAVTPSFVAALVALGAVGVQTAVLPAVGLALAVAVLVGGLAAPWLALRFERHATSALAAGRRSVAAQVLGLFESAAELIAFGAHVGRRRRLAATDAVLVADARRQAVGTGAAEALITLVCGAAAVLGTGLAADAVAAGRLDGVLVPLLALVPLALAEVLATLPPVAQHWDTLRAARVRLADFPASDVDARAQTSRSIDVTHADIAWPDREPVLWDVDLHIPHGTQVAVVGPSGAGKSTLIAALLGFLPPSRGEISVPAKVAWAPQEPQLVSTTVAENLRLAKSGATDEELRHALDLAALDDVRLDTVLGSAGAGLSGGQAQRVALARALLAAPEADFVLLDEPTAHLDELTARKLLANLRRELAGHTVVQVTHHRDEAVDADLVLEVREGHVITKEPAGRLV
ncbi:MAG: fused ATPase and permease component of transport system [Amycolatopsis sp.]|uniref:thiol reductant ABC exporter subunit CydD n=1 Tax=Amycolatopsis sp. TaxID=37632 RepID=UPI0026343FD2|nr:thiol reductant ABC exporter subunit CydD [Amycolatopsis sp.]MCU1685541.1 fused ATPase and permease component of transport system [Amycolatopsis sp.]